MLQKKPTKTYIVINKGMQLEAFTRKALYLQLDDVIMMGVPQAPRVCSSRHQNSDMITEDQLTHVIKNNSNNISIFHNCTLCIKDNLQGTEI